MWVQNEMTLRRRCSRASRRWMLREPSSKRILSREQKEITRKRSSWKQKGRFLLVLLVSRAHAIPPAARVWPVLILVVFRIKAETRLSVMEKATLGGGCFWCVEAVFDRLRGVERVVSGYAGGSVPNPSYRQVTTGTTGHAEVVQVTFDPDEVSYRTLLEVFFTTHDPTTLNRQGADRGTQYRSVILYHDEEQRQTAEAVRAEMAGVWDDPIVTEIAPLDTFYEAEAYHQDYYANNAAQPYCQAVIAPKVAKLRKQHLDKLSAPSSV